jgi:hypothetical protein
VAITLTGGDTYVAAPAVSDMAVLWGESFCSKERKFLRELLKSDTISFSLKATYQIHLRSLWHPNSMQSINLARGGRRQGKFAMLLHDFVGDLTTSWTWAKFIRPLYRQGFSVVAVDFPGFGRSSVAQACACDRKDWAGQEAHVVSKIMEENSIVKCQMLAVGHSCGMLFSVLQGSAHRMAGQHVLVNPVFDRNALFAHVGIEPPPGAQAGWQEVIKQKQQSALIELLRTTGVKLWCIFDRSRSYRNMQPLLKGKDGARPNKELQREWQMALETSEMLFAASRHEIVGPYLRVTEITDQDLCEAQIGKKVPLRMFIPSRHLKASIARFLSKTDNKQWDQMFTPNHVAFGKGISRTAKKADQVGMGAHEEFDRFDDSEHSSSEDDDPRNARNKDYGKLALKDMRQKGVDRMLDSKFETERDRNELVAVRDQKESDERVQFLKDQEAKDNMRPEYGARPVFKEKPLEKSASAPTLKRQHTLYAAADVAKEKLTKSGASKKPQIITAEVSRDMKAMNWAKVPYEADLSYGVRKMYLDAFEASVASYGEQAETEYQRLRAHRARTAVRGGQGGRR